MNTANYRNLSWRVQREYRGQQQDDDLDARQHRRRVHGELQGHGVTGSRGRGYELRNGILNACNTINA